ncbi:MAG TPA: tetratricopeptide repeat protein [Crocinitomix sp.]|nr:tetratricopeptide repeat protein [Crocinitomix sp.]
MINILKILPLVALLTFSACKNRKDLAKKERILQEERIIDFKEVFHQANSEKMIGHHEKAIKLFNECLTLNPKSAVSYFALSEIYLKEKQTDKAIEYAQKAYGLNPSNKWYVVHLADMFYNVGNYHQSAKFYQILINKFEERNVEYRYRYAESLIYSNQELKAIQQLNIIELEVGKSPELTLTKHDLYQSIGKTDEAQKEIDNLLDDFPKNEAVRTTLLNYYLQTNQLKEAENMAKQILILNPNNGNALIGLADIEIRNNNITKSFDYLDKGFQSVDVDTERKLSLLNGLTSYVFNNNEPNSALINERLAPLYETLEITEANNSDFLKLYATYLELNHQNQKARKLYAKSCQLAPSNYNVWDALLNIDYKIKLYDSLYTDGLKALEYFPSQPILYLLTSIGAYETQKYDEAEEYLFLGKDLVINDPELLSEFQYHIGKNYWKQGQKDEAKTYFNKALKIYPNNAKIYNGYALLLLEDGNLDLAENEIIKALNKDFKNVTFIDTYGKILIEKKQYKEALKQYEKAVAFEYNNPLILEHYGDALFYNGNIDKAVEMWKESKRLGNTSSEINQKITKKKL